MASVSNSSPVIAGEHLLMHAPNTEVRNNFQTVQQESPAISNRLHDAYAYVPRFRYEIQLHLFNKQVFIFCLQRHSDFR